MRSLLVVAILAGCHSAPEPVKTEPVKTSPRWSDATFDANVQAVLASRFKGKTISKMDGDDGYRVDTLEVRFTKARNECREDWSHCAESVERTLQAMDELQHPKPVTRAQLRVILRSNDKLAMVEARMKGVTTAPFSSDAQWVLAVDTPSMVGYDVKLDTLNLSADEAWKIAVENTKPANVVTTTSDNGTIVYQDVYAPSALRYPELLDAAARKAAPKRNGNLLAVCPEENIVLYTIGGPSEAAALQQAASSGAADSVMPLSTHVMEWSKGSWHER
jgi:hypothetical protein